MSSLRSIIFSIVLIALGFHATAQQYPVDLKGPKEFQYEIVVKEDANYVHVESKERIKRIDRLEEGKVFTSYEVGDKEVDLYLPKGVHYLRIYDYGEKQSVRRVVL